MYLLKCQNLPLAQTVIISPTIMLTALFNVVNYLSPLRYDLVKVFMSWGLTAISIIYFRLVMATLSKLVNVSMGKNFVGDRLPAFSKRVLVCGGSFQF